MGSEIHKCLDCGKIFDAKHKFNKHRKTHVKTHKCSICTKEFGLKTDFKRHRITHLKPESRFVHKCPHPECAFKGSLRQEILTAHLRKFHANDGKFGHVEKLLFVDEAEFLKRQQLVQADKTLEFFESVSRGDKDDVERLLSEDSTALLAAQDSTWSTALHLAAREGHLAVAESLLASGASVDSMNYNKYTPLHFAAKEGLLAVAELLLARGASVDSSTLFTTPLHLAAIGGHLTVAELLLDSGANVNKLEGYKGTSLHYAVMNRHLAVATLLLENGANVNFKSRYGRAPLHCATDIQIPEMIKILLEANAEVDVEDNGKRTPLSNAIGRTPWSSSQQKETYEKSTKILLAAGAEFSDLDWEYLSHEDKQMFANYRPAEAEGAQTSDPAIIPWNAEDDEEYVDIVRRARERATGQ
ncbi:ankyrin repeat-containing domain protein [Cadophora sp. MPI-SDFR-AT-0126]|nr:ankyrin repeat-containing domain protein [Leotiomycetes sp. MPI-SDFR-AT-0126]